MTPDELEKWKMQQINAAVKWGVNAIDATNAVSRFLAKLPYDADPNTYIAPAHTLEQDLSSAEVQMDMRASWYGDEHVPPRFKRILDAKGVA